VACLVVAETGFFLVGILVLDQVALAAVLYTVLVQLFAWTGAFYLLGFLHDRLGSDRLSDLKGALAKAAPECVCLILCLVCAVGVPPFPGFMGKFAVIGSALHHQWYLLALLAIAAMAMGLVASARLAFSLIGDFAQSSLKSELIPADPARRAFLAALILPMIFIGVFAQWLLVWASQSIPFVFW
jgi:NADH:ubiquinone oxidoreductase subunit 2 (subunit N)